MLFVGFMGTASHARPDIFQPHVKGKVVNSVVFNEEPDTVSRPPATPVVKLLHVPGSFAVCKLDAGSPVPSSVTTGDFFNVTRTPDELSVVCRQEVVPEGVVCERGWCCLRVAGAMPFTLVGVLASLTTPIAGAGVGVFAVSTFDTDYLLLKAGEMSKAVAALRAAGHEVEA